MLFSSPFSIISEAAYGTSFTATVTGDTPQATPFSVVSTYQTFATLESYGSVYLQANWNADGIQDGYVTQGVFSGYLNATAPAVTNWSVKSIEVVIENVSYDTAQVSFGVEPYVYNNGRGFFYARFSHINQRPQVGVNVFYKVVAVYERSSGSSIWSDLTIRPTVTLSSLSCQGQYTPMESFFPDLHKIQEGLLNSQTGWLPIMNTNLSTIASNTGTANVWLQNISGNTSLTNTYLGYTNNYLLSIKNNTDDIVEYIQATGAADVVEDANDAFVNDAASLEADQAILEAAADDAFDSVDMDVSLLGTYSTAMSFWMRCINALPTTTGAIWDVLVFAFLISFLIFILRLVR